MNRWERARRQSVPDYSAGIPADLLLDAQRLAEHVLLIVNGLAQDGDAVAARAVGPTRECIAKIEGARAGIAAAPKEMPDPMKLAGTLD